MITIEDFTRIKNDSNGNTRYVCHFLKLVKDQDFNFGTRDMTENEVIKYVYGMSRTEYGYKLALKRSRQLGGRKYNTKGYGGGIVFQSFNIQDTCNKINALIA